MPVFEGSGHGDLFVTYNVVLPTSLNDTLKQRQFYRHQLKIYAYHFFGRTIRSVYGPNGGNKPR
jgi:hypothetical protein